MREKAHIFAVLEMELNKRAKYARKAKKAGKKK
jgi:hypothetical protein